MNNHAYQSEGTPSALLDPKLNQGT